MHNIYLKKGLGGMDKKQVEQVLRDYNWMIKEIKRQRSLMGYDGGNLVAQGGIESTMPKAQGGTSDPVALEVIRREKASKWVIKLEDKVLYIQKRIPVITDEREKAVLECMLDGLSMMAITKHMGLSRTHIYRIKDSVIDKMLQFEQSEQRMTAEKQCG